MAVAVSVVERACPIGLEVADLAATAKRSITPVSSVGVTVKHLEVVGDSGGTDRHPRSASLASTNEPFSNLDYQFKNVGEPSARACLPEFPA